MVAINPEIFREYDIRGLAETDLSREVLRVLGSALAAYFRPFGISRIVIGRDNRLSSSRIRDTLVDVLSEGGYDILDIGVTIAPIFYYACLTNGNKAGIMITASHNPPEYNGFKIFRGHGTIYGREIQGLRCLAESVCGVPRARTGSADKMKHINITDEYLDMLARKLKLGPRRFKVAVDCGNGTAGLFVDGFLGRLGCELIPLYCESDGAFPHHQPDPVRHCNLSDLRALVAEAGADVGIAYDGDGDRIGVVDELGNIIDGDKLMVLFWREILPRFPGALAIVEVKCSQALVDEIGRLGGNPFFYKTGHSLIKAKMRETGAVFAGEMSGHMFFADEYYGFDDAFYATGRLLRILSNTDYPLSKLFEDVPKYYATGETRVPCSDAYKFRVVEELKNRFKADYEVIDVDGVRVLFPEGWGLVRASNTQPVIVARCEGRSPEALQEIVGLVERELLRFPEVGRFEWEGL